jgi:hypothetical protein
MTKNSIVVDALADDVFDALDDAYAYPRWVVGARRIRWVDAAWPAVGSRFHHAVGTFVAELHDSTLVVARERPRLIELEVRFRPTGVARVQIVVDAAAHGTLVTLYETPTSGPVLRIPRFVRDPALSARNALSLRRFRRLVERRASGAQFGSTGSRNGAEIR